VRFLSRLLISLAAAMLLTSLVCAQVASGGVVDRVLLISVDGFHAVDLANYTKANPNSNLAALSQAGVTYTTASTPHPSDSFPGTLALVTGGSPNSTGVWYDDSYDRSLAPPPDTSNIGTSPAPCVPGVAGPGTEVLFDETADLNKNVIDGGRGLNVKVLPLDPMNNCKPVFPHNFLRVNTIFEVIKAGGGLTAWSDKHLSYDLVNGPSGIGVDDLYTPEIAANGDATTSLAKVLAYDALKVTAVLNWIKGKKHDGTGNPGVPTIFGMNFQAVSVGQKLPSGGYTDLFGTPTATLKTALDFVDTSLAQMVSQLRQNGLLNGTLIIITAKHGQTPIDPHKLRTIATGGISVRPSDAVNNAAQITEDDISLIWLNDSADTDATANYLELFLSFAAIQKILTDEALKLNFNSPLKDPRVPDIIVQPELGVIYTGSKGGAIKKVAGHGGFSEDDTHVALLISNPSLSSKKIKSPVETMQVAPTILKALGFTPSDLQSVKSEKTKTLPGLNLSSISDNSQ